MDLETFIWLCRGQVVWCEDCAAMLHHILHLGNVEDCYIGVDNEPVHQCVVMNWLADELGVAAGESVATDRDMEHLAGGDRGKQLNNGRIVSSGYHFKYGNFRQGYGPMIETILSKRQS